MGGKAHLGRCATGGLLWWNGCGATTHLCGGGGTGATKLEGYAPDRVLSSPLSRATRLANAVGYTGVDTDERLREQHFGAWEMLPYDEIKDPQLLRWYEDYVYEQPTGGESFAEVVSRVGTLLEELKGSHHQKILIFAHGGIQMAVGAYLGLYELVEAPQHFQGYGSVMKYQL